MMRIQGHLTPNPGTRSSGPTPEEVWADAAAQGNGKQKSSSKCCLAMVISIVGFIFLLGIGIVFYWHISSEETRDLELEKSRKKTSRQGQKEFLEKMNQWDSAADGDQVHAYKLKDKSTKMKFKPKITWFSKKEKGSQDSSEEKTGPPEEFKYKKKSKWAFWKKQKLTKAQEHEKEKEEAAKAEAEKLKKDEKAKKKADKAAKKAAKKAEKEAKKKNKSSRRRAAEVLELEGRRRLGGIHPTMARLQREIQEAQEAHDRKTRSETRELRRRLAESSSRGPPLNGIARRRRRMASVRSNKVTGTRRRLAISPLMARLQREIKRAQEEHDRKQSNDHDL